MKYPKLVRRAKTPVRVVIESPEPNEFNEREILLNKEFLCNYQDSSSLRYSAEKQVQELAGITYIDGDIIPPVQVISAGYIVIFGQQYSIKKGTKARNLDGSVNYTKLEVI